MPKKRHTRVNPLNLRRNTFQRRDDSPQYKAWHAAVLKRDKYCCKWPSCGAKRQLQCHHIRRWADFPLLRYNVANGITLCRKHHTEVKGKEENYERLFLGLLIKTEDRIRVNEAMKKDEQTTENLCNPSGYERTTSVEF
jgi:hypothetical protein